MNGCILVRIWWERLKALDHCKMQSTVYCLFDIKCDIMDIGLYTILISSVTPFDLFKYEVQVIKWNYVSLCCPLYLLHFHLKDEFHSDWLLLGSLPNTKTVSSYSNKSWELDFHIITIKCIYKWNYVSFEGSQFEMCFFNFHFWSRTIFCVFVVLYSKSKRWLFENEPQQKNFFLYYVETLKWSQI